VAKGQSRFPDAVSNFLVVAEIPGLKPQDTGLNSGAGDCIQRVQPFTERVPPTAINVLADGKVTSKYYHI
jgi:hypothetical protein